MVRAASRLEDRGVRNLVLKTGAPDDRDGHQPAAPAHDRRHDGPQFRGEDAERLHPPRQEPHGLPRPIARHGHSRGAAPLPAAADRGRRPPGAGPPPPTINSAVSALRFFFSVTADRPAVTKPLTFVAEPRKIPVVLSPEEVARFLEAAPGPKYKAALSAGYGAGLRVSEVVALKVSDVDSRRMLLKIEHGKGRKDRLAMLSPQLLELLRDWWRIARPQVWLFPGQNPVTPLTTRQLNRAVHAAAQRAGITKRVTPHTLRHSFATHLLEQNIDIRVIQVLLGHAKLETTALYTRVATNTIRMVMSPLDRLTPIRMKPGEPPA